MGEVKVVIKWWCDGVCVCVYMFRNGLMGSMLSPWSIVFGIPEPQSFPLSSYTGVVSRSVGKNELCGEVH